MARNLSFVGLIAACFVVLTIADKEEFYDDKYDHLDVEAVLANERLRTQYIKCFLETSPCLTPEAIFIKSKFPEAIVTKCRKCTDKQRDAFSKVAEWFTTNDTESWNTIIRKAITDYTMLGALRRSTTPRAKRAMN